MHILRSRLICLTVAALAVIAIAGVPAASAQSSADDPSAAQYDPPLPDEGTGSNSASGGSGLDGNIGSLPFTGLDLLIIVGVALLLTGTGFALRRLSTPPQPRG